jgi:type IV pilus assembly protein PilB
MPFIVGWVPGAEHDVRYNGRFIDFRVSIMPSSHGEDAVLRVLDKQTLSEKFRDLSLDVVGFDPGEMARFRRYIREPYGMVLVAGPTGSGKTTTLYGRSMKSRATKTKSSRLKTRSNISSPASRRSL